mgnify:CR=1 FL=1
MAVYVHLYQVRLLRPLSFPIDMLRYDCSYPHESKDASLIGDTFEYRYARSTEATQALISLEHRGPDRQWQPNVDRWRSMGWEVMGRGAALLRKMS